MQTEMEKIWYLKHINIFKGMTEADLASVERMTHMKAYGRREQVYGQGDEGDVVYLLKEGRVKNLQAITRWQRIDPRTPRTG